MHWVFCHRNLYSPVSLPYLSYRVSPLSSHLHAFLPCFCFPISHLSSPFPFFPYPTTPLFTPSTSPFPYLYACPVYCLASLVTPPFLHTPSTSLFSSLSLPPPPCPLYLLHPPPPSTSPFSYLLSCLCFHVSPPLIITPLLPSPVYTPILLPVSAPPISPPPPSSLVYISILLSPLVTTLLLPSPVYSYLLPCLYFPHLPCLCFQPLLCRVSLATPPPPSSPSTSPVSYLHPCFSSPVSPLLHFRTRLSSTPSKKKLITIYLTQIVIHSFQRYNNYYS